MTNTDEMMKWDMFARESHMLAHLFEEPDAATLNAYRVLMASPTLSIAALTHISTAVSAGALPRVEALPDLQELLSNVNLGIAAIDMDLKHVPPGQRTSAEMAKRAWLAYTLHRAMFELQAYRSQGPVSVMGVNGIVGRAAWLWVMKEYEGTFLTSWYQQSLRFGGVAQLEAKDK